MHSCRYDNLTISSSSHKNNILKVSYYDALYFLRYTHPRYINRVLFLYRAEHIVKFLNLHFVPLNFKETYHGSNWRSANRDSQIDFAFSRITLSNFFWNSWIKTFFLLEFFVFKLLFRLHTQQIAFVLLQKVLNCTFFFRISIAFWPKSLGALSSNTQWGSLQCSSSPPTHWT